MRFCFKDEISNAPQTGLTTVKFATTKPMSSYLACFIVCDFDYSEGNATNGGFSVNVFARREQISNIHFAKKVAVNASNFYLSYFDIPYPLPKLGKVFVKNEISWIHFYMSLIMLFVYRFDRDSRFCFRCYGKLGFDHFSRNQIAV